MYEHMISVAYLSLIEFFGKNLSANNDTRKQKLLNDCGKSLSNIEVRKLKRRGRRNFVTSMHKLFVVRIHSDFFATHRLRPVYVKPDPRAAKPITPPYV